MSTASVEKGGMGPRELLKDPEDFPSADGTRDLRKESHDLQGSEIRITVPWGVIAGKAWGDPSGSPVLGIHGWMDNAGTFDKLAPMLLKSHFFVAVEMPGHGFSSHYPPGMPYHFVDYVLVVKRIIRHLGWSKFSIIGHSMGAGIGALYSSVFPQEIEQLVLLDLAKPITGSGNFASKIAIGVDAFLAIEEKIDPIPPTYSYFDALDRLIKATQNALSEDAAKILLVRGSRQVDEDRYSFTRDLRLRSPTLSRFSHQDIYEILGEIRCRVLYLQAEQAPSFEEPGLQEKALEIYKSKSAEFKSVVVKGNHFFHLNDPTEAVSIINQFFQQRKAGL